jgi:hypothetical protein
MKKIILSFQIFVSLTAFSQNFYINKVWEKETATLLGDENRIASILNSSGNLISVSNNKNANASNIFVNQLNAEGQIMWQDEIANSLNVAGIENYGSDITQDAYGNTYACGVNYNGKNYDYLIVKHNLNGEEIWRQSYNGTGNGDDAPTSIIHDKNNDIYVTGASFGSNSLADILTLKLDGQTGEIVWTSRYDFNKKYDVGTKLKIDNDNNLIVAGHQIQV